MTKREVGDLITSDSPICCYCASYKKPEDQEYCDSCDKYELNNFVGIECYKTIED